MASMNFVDISTNNLFEEPQTILAVETNLKHFTFWLKDKENRSNLPEGFFEYLTKVLHHSVQAILLCKQQTCPLDKMSLVLNVMTECFRILRNCCAQNMSNQNDILRNSELFTLVITLSDELLELYQKPNSSYLLPVSSDVSLVTVTIRCCVQFWGNLIVGNEAAKEKVWKHLYNVFSPLLNGYDATISNFCCMVIYNALNPTHEDILLNEGSHLILQAIITSVHKHKTEWGEYIIEHLIQKNNIMKNCYPNFTDDVKLDLLNVLYEWLLAWENQPSRLNFVNESQMIVIAQCFIHQAPSLPSLIEQNNITVSLIIVKLLKLLCIATSIPDHYDRIKEHSGLLESSIELLRTLHLLGKSEQNIFSTQKKILMADLDIQNHPVYNLKGELIRLISNLCFRHRANQDKVRHLDGIHLILELSQIDGYNPFITQWSVFAIRNLCENNIENQSIIGELNIESISDTSILNNLKMKAELKDGQVKVMSSENKNI